MKRVFVLFTLLVSLGSLSANAYFPVGECFNPSVNFGLGASMGFGAGGCSGICGGGFGLSGNTNFLLGSYAPTGAFYNPYAFNGFNSTFGMGINPLTGQRQPGWGTPGGIGRFGGYGAGARVGLNLGGLSPVLAQLLLGGITVGGNLGITAGGNIYNGGRFTPAYPGPIPYGPYPYSTGLIR